MLTGVSMIRDLATVTARSLVTSPEVSCGAAVEGPGACSVGSSARAAGDQAGTERMAIVATHLASIYLSSVNRCSDLRVPEMVSRTKTCGLGGGGAITGGGGAAAIRGFLRTGLGFCCSTSSLAFLLGSAPNNWATAAPLVLETCVSSGLRRMSWMVVWLAAR